MPDVKSLGARRFWSVPIVLGLTGLVAMVFLGGASRPEEWRTQAFRAVACIVVLVILYWKWRRNVHFQASTLHYWVTVILVGALYLIPLPFSLWSMFPGRDEIADLFKAAGMSSVWRPLTLSPSLTLNFTGAALAPIAATLVYGALQGDQRQGVAPALILCALLSVLWGSAQHITQAATLWIYDVTNDGRMTGMFANRNHNATFAVVAVPLCIREFFRAGDRSARLAPFYGIAAFALLTGAMLNGSRSAVITAAIATFGCTLVLWRHGSAARHWAGSKLVLLGLLFVGIVGLMALAFAQISPGVARLFDEGAMEGRRGELFAELFRMAYHYFPIGSGPGSFELAYRSFEGDRFVNQRFLNEAHDDALQMVIEMGVFGLALIVWPAVGIVRLAVSGWKLGSGRHQAQIACLLIALIVLAVASLVDYPMRTAILLTGFGLLWCELLQIANQLARQPKRPGADKVGGAMGVF